MSTRQGQGGNAGKTQSTTSATLIGRPTQNGNLSGIGGGQCKNIFYDLQARQDPEGSPHVVTGMLGVFDLDVSKLLDTWSILSFVTLYIEVEFSVSLETLSERLLVFIPVDDPVIATCIYINCLS